MRVLVIGCGRVGAELANVLAQQDHSVAVVDVNPEAFERLDTSFTGDKIAGVGFDREVLLQAGIERADALAALTADDNANIITARLARNVYRVPKVITRLYDPRRAEIYERLGLLTVSSTAWSVQRIAQLLEHRDLDVVLAIGDGQVEVIEVEAPPTWEGHAISSVNTPGELLVVAITRLGKTSIPTSGAVFRAGDRVALAVLPSTHRRLERMLTGA
jgi:trk system potassium uptake protein TrkA